MSVLGSRVLRYVIEEKRFDLLTQEGINEEYFVGSSRDGYVYLRDELAKGKSPSVVEVSEIAKVDLSVKEDASTIPHLIRQIKKRYVVRNVKPIISKAVELFEKGDALEALQMMEKADELKRVLIDVDDISVRASRVRICFDRFSPLVLPC